MAKTHFTPRRDVYALITDRIVWLLEQGTIPWRKPWASVAPQNLLTGKAYRGINPFVLACSGYSSPFWLTFKQARQLGGHVKRGAKSTPVVFWKVYEKQMEDEEGEEQTVRLPVLRHYNVFTWRNARGFPLGESPRLKPANSSPSKRPKGLPKGCPSVHRSCTGQPGLGTSRCGMWSGCRNRATSPR